MPLLKSSQFDLHSKIKSISMPPHKNTKLISIHTLKPSIFRPPRQNQVNSDTYTEVKSISIPTIKSNQFWGRTTKNKLISIPTLKPNLFRPPQWNQVNSDPYAEIKWSSIPLITKSIPIQTLKPIHFRPPDKNQANSDRPHQKRFNFDPHTENNLISIQRLKPRHFRHPHQDQVNSDPYTEIKSTSRSRNLIKSISTTQTQMKSRSMLILKLSDFAARTQKPTQFRPPPTLKPSQSIIALKTS